MGGVAPINAAVEYSGAQLDLIRRTVAKDCNADEFDLFVTVARRVGLDPFRRQIMALVFNKDKADRRQMAIVTGIDGLRAIAARSRRYRPDEREPDYEVETEAKSALSNPLGLIKAAVTIHIADDRREGGWKPVMGVAYWEEFAPLEEDSTSGWDWEETGETWPDTGKPKKRKVPRQGGEIIKRLDTRGQWGRMPRVMLAKCAEAQALRKAFPEDLSGLYEYAELDRTQAEDLSPSQVIGAFQTEARLERIGAANGITFQMTPDRPLEPISLGRAFDLISAAVADFTLDQLDWFESANTHPLREFWARAKADALELKKVLEATRARLVEAAKAQ